MTAVRGIAEVVLNARDIAASTAFYRDIVGLSVHTQSPEDEPTIVFLKTADLPSPFGDAHPQVLALIDPARHRFAAGRFDTPAVRTSTLNHVAFWIGAADYEPELARLTALGVETTTAEFPKMRARAIFFKDPELNSVEFICHDPDA